MAARGPDSVDDRTVDDKVSHPVGLRHRKYVWMLPQTPGENAGSRTRRTDNKNRSVYPTLHFDCIVCLPVSLIIFCSHPQRDKNIRRVQFSPLLETGSQTTLHP